MTPLVSLKLQWFAGSLVIPFLVSTLLKFPQQELNIVYHDVREAYSINHGMFIPIALHIVCIFFLSIASHHLHLLHTLLVQEIICTCTQIQLLCKLRC